MCGTCGCGTSERHARISHAHSHLAPETRGPRSAPVSVHAHEHGHPHDPDRSTDGFEARRISVEQSLVAGNQSRAEKLAARLAEQGIEAIGLVGGPGVGKTALLEASFERLGREAAGREAVVEGDCATDFDARRIAARGARVAQVETGSLCHLDAHLVEHALEQIPLADVSRVWIENVGNLVCPAAFACGERRRVVLVSVTDGDDKPEKYPAIFAGADLLVITKVDLLPYVAFDVDRCVHSARHVRPGLPWIALSAKTGEGLDRWLAWADAAGC